MSVLSRVPLWARLVAGTLLLVTLAVTVTGGFAVRLLRGYLVDRVDHQLGVAAHALRDLRDPPPGQPGAARQFGLFYMATLGPDGTVGRTLQESPDTEPPRLPRITPGVLPGGFSRPFTVLSPSGTPWRAQAVVTRARVRVIAIRVDDVDATVSRLGVIVTSTGAVVLVVLGFACHWLVRRSLRPLGEIERTAEAIAGGDLSRRVPPRHPGTETGRLGRSVNGMLAQIETAFRAREASETAARHAATEARRSESRMRRFVADASHELRTPLTSIRGFAELYRHEPPDLTEASRLLSRIESEATRMTGLVDDLLLLARLDENRPQPVDGGPPGQDHPAGRPRPLGHHLAEPPPAPGHHLADRPRPLDRRPVDVLSLAAGAVLDARALAPDREVDLRRLDGADGPVTVTGDESRLRQVLGNLVGNVLHHTPAGTPFELAVGTVDGAVVIEITDHGPGIPPEHAGHVFDRFYRADPSRTRATGGTGLGLSVVAALVEAHDGRVTHTTSPQATTFRLTFPVPEG
ncbi:HAMP domain-containing sensor histidine kinase [Sphaerisporangium sp. B11E5]|uniref:sensor histidine kinase n=1 Tax=Sphaerisporangium sp. B11E5 TaxID=3153563 RepID=UPI00325EC371